MMKKLVVSLAGDTTYYSLILSYDTILRDLAMTSGGGGEGPEGVLLSVRPSGQNFVRGVGTKFSYNCPEGNYI